MRRPLVPVLTSALLCLALSGCKVTSEDIDEWTGTQKGPGKIVAVFLADKYEDDLRKYAGLALVRMEPRASTASHDPIDGVVELQAAARQLEPDTRHRIIDMMVPELVSMMQGGDRAANEEEVAHLQVRSKDAAFLLLPYASDGPRETLTHAIVDWFAVDFERRNLSGTYTAEQVVRQLGAPAASRLVGALRAQLPQRSMVKIAELIAAIGDRDTKARAAERMIEIEREMESDEFMESLRERLREQLRAAGQEIDEDRVNAAAVLNRENFINLGALPAMRHLNDERAIQDRLMEIAMSNGTDERALARRKPALLALEGAAREDHAERLLTLALTPNPPPREDPNWDRLRDAAFDRVSDTRSRAVIPRLWQTFDATSSWVVRYRVGTLILSLGGADVAQQFFGHLTANEYAQEELYNYGRAIAGIRPPPTELVNEKLRSDRWYDRVIALYFYERRATREDLARVTALESDSVATAGEHWDDQNTVGKVAESVSAAIQERLARADDGTDESGEAAGSDEQPGGDEGAAQ